MAGPKQECQNQCHCRLVLNGNEDIWGKWVTADAAKGIKAALAAKETPKGWPTE